MVNDVIYKNSKFRLPSELKPVISDLIENPLYMIIGKYFNEIPFQLHVDKLLLIDEICAQTKEDYYKIDKTINEMEVKKYLVIQKQSMPNYFLGASFAEALEITQTINEEFQPLINDIKNDADFKKYENIDIIFMNSLYKSIIE